MNYAAATQPLPYKSNPFTIIKGKEEYELQLRQLTAIAWQIGYTSLWNGQTFTANETAAAQQLIASFLRQGSPLKAYSEFVQRVLLARQYILTHPGAYAPHPSRWLSPENANGFAGTSRWFRNLEEARSREPYFKQYLKAFPEAVLETLQSGKAGDFHYWRSWFAERGAQATLNLFLAVLGNCKAAAKE